MQFPTDLRLLIVEDNSFFSNLILLLLHELGLQNIQVAADYESGWGAYRSTGADICILDIDLGKGKKNGIQLAEKIREHDTAVRIIYLTDNYTEDYYEQTRLTRPSSFMNKEISRFKLQQALDLALMHNEQSTRTTSPAIPSSPLHITNEQFFFKIGDVYKATAVKEVAYFYAEDKLTFARIGQRDYPTSIQLKVLEEEFFAYFARIHKSYLVNIGLIEAIRPKENSIDINGETLPIGHTYRKSFLDRLHLFQ